LSSSQPPLHLPVISWPPAAKAALQIPAHEWGARLNAPGKCWGPGFPSTSCPTGGPQRSPRPPVNSLQSGSRPHTEKAPLRAKAKLTAIMPFGMGAEDLRWEPMGQLEVCLPPPTSTPSNSLRTRPGWEPRLLSLILHPALEAEASLKLTGLAHKWQSQDFYQPPCSPRYLASCL
jgi:hypothetical protein